MLLRRYHETEKTPPSKLEGGVDEKQVEEHKEETTKRRGRKKQGD